MELTRRDALVGAAALAAMPSSLQAGERPEEPKHGGVVSVHMTSEQRILNAALRASTGVYVIPSKLMDPLVDLDADGQPKPMPRTGWDTRANGKRTRYRLGQER